MIAVDQVDDLHMTRQHALHQPHGPGFKRFGEQGVIGVRQGIDGDFPGRRPLDAVFINQDAHQFRNGDRGMGVVELDGNMLGQIQQRVVNVQVSAQQILQRSRDKEKLLAQAQLLPGLVAVCRIQHTGDAFGTHHLGHCTQMVTGVETPQVQVMQGPGPPQAQGVDTGTAPADDGCVIGDGPHRLAGFPDLA